MANASPFVEPEAGVRYRRPWTPPRRDPETGKTSLTTKRVCNGCQRLIGDGTVEEVDHVMAGGDWPDVRGECPWCTPDDDADARLGAAVRTHLEGRGMLVPEGNRIGGVVTDAGGGSVRVLVDRDTPQYPSLNDRVFIVIR